MVRLLCSEASLVPPEEVLAVGTLVGDAVEAVDAARDAGARPKSETKRISFEKIVQQNGKEVKLMWIAKGKPGVILNSKKM